MALAHAGYHLTNLLLHAAAAMLLCVVLCRMTGRVWPSAIAAALFAVHPLRAESVAWVTERKDVLSGLFFMLTLAAYVDYVRHRPSIARYLVVAAFFALGLLSKAMLVTLPVLLLLLDYWPLGRFAGGPSFWRLVMEKVPLLLLVAVVSVVTVSIQGQALASNQFIPWQWQINNALISYVIYLRSFSFRPAWRPCIHRGFSISTLEGSGFGPDSVGRHGGNSGLEAEVSVPFGRLALVPGNAVAGNRAAARGRLPRGQTASPI